MFKTDIGKYYKAFLYCAKISIDASKKYAILRLVLEIILSALPLVSLTLSRTIINNLAYASNDRCLETVILIIGTAVVLLVNSGLGTIRSYVTQCHNLKIDLLISQKKFFKSTEIDLAYFDSAEYYNSYTNAAMNSASISKNLWDLYHLVGLIIKTSGLFLMFSRYSLLLAFLLLVFSLPFALVENYYKEKNLLLQKELVPLNRKMAYVGSIFTSKQYAMEMRLYNVSKYIYDKFEDDWKVRYKRSNEIVRKQAAQSFLSTNVPQLVIVVATIYLSLNVFAGELMIGDYTYVTGSAQQLLGGMIAILSSLARYKDSTNRTIEFIDFLNIKSEVVDAGDETIDDKIEHEIRFQNVSFKYPGTDRNVLENVSLTFSTKERVAFVGQNGSGKTTIIKLLLRFYDVDQGEILIDGISVKEYRLEALRSLFSVMPQNYNRYAFSLRDNVGLSSVCDIDNDDNIIKTLHQAGAKGILEKLTGIDSYLMRIYSDDGFELSGGEWQKIALSRCLFKKAPVVILDEPSSAIDAKSENELFKNIFADQDICGSVLISHRLSNVKDSDQIFVLDKASVVESGSHDELIARRGLYSEMYNLQLKKYL